MNAPNPAGWRPDLGPVIAADAVPDTASGDRALALEEALIFELGVAGGCGVDFDALLTDVQPGLTKFLRAARSTCPG